MNKICFYPHPSSLNHGCEAILVSTINILKNKSDFIFKSTLLVKYNIGSPKLGDNTAYSLIDTVVPCPLPTMRQYSPTWLKYQLGKLIKQDKSCDLLASIFSKQNKFVIDNNDIFVSIGGDNYCYGRPVPFYAIHKAVINNQKKSILWGCSIEPESITQEMLDDLRKYNKIVARESITYETLISKGLKNVELFPDPAFTLPKGEGLVINRPTVGINVSPMIFEYANYTSILLKAFKKMVDYILRETEYDIAFIPHVTAETTDDRTAIKKVVEEENDRIIIIDDDNCMNLKNIISQCEMFIGARTHATIAAYSTCVPTLVCGYSVKSKGIAKDIFGTYENYVIPVQTIQNEDALVNSFKWLSNNKSSIKNTLCEKMPGYISQACAAGGIIFDVCK